MNASRHTYRDIEVFRVQCLDPLGCKTRLSNDLQSISALRVRNMVNLKNHHFRIRKVPGRHDLTKLPLRLHSLDILRLEIFVVVYYELAGIVELLVYERFLPVR